MISPDYLATWASGECRCLLAIGREDIHVYCHAPMIRGMTCWGREGWLPGPRRYCVVCPDAGLDYGDWVTAEAAAARISEIVAGTVPAAA